MIVSKKRFYTGLGIMMVFTVILVGMFLPLFDGDNIFKNADELYNSISKGSANYISDTLKESEEYIGVSIEADIEMDGDEEAAQAGLLYEGSGAEVVVSGAQLVVTGDLGHILGSTVQDSETLYSNDIDSLTQKYGYNGLRVVYNWHESLVRLEEELERQDLIDASEAVARVNEKVVEPAYNYFGIEPEKMSDKAGVVVGSLFFYVFYTVLYGFGIMYMFEGWGLKTGEH